MKRLLIAETAALVAGSLSALLQRVQLATHLQIIAIWRHSVEQQLSSTVLFASQLKRADSQAAILRSRIRFADEDLIQFRADARGLLLSTKSLVAERTAAAEEIERFCAVNREKLARMRVRLNSKKQTNAPFGALAREAMLARRVTGNRSGGTMFGEEETK